MQKYLILGTAGHIDHGKTSLIRALTGVDTDRLPEEKKRGITIELGYAKLLVGEFQLGIVDVPGHERFVRQMLAGATGMDMVMLIVAADDSIKQQTREHLDILRLLNLKYGIIVVTKIDMVDEDWCELVEAEVRDLVQDTFLAQAPLMRVSSKTGAGIEELKLELGRIANLAFEFRRGAENDPFRMAIDRTFTADGFGTIVTGSVASGRLSIGETVEIQPRGLTARIRGLQNHDATTESLGRGQRAAINLTGIHHDSIQRGDEIASPGHLVPTQQVGVELFALAGITRPIRDRVRVKLHLGTTEVAANLRLPAHSKELAAGETGTAVAYLKEPVVAVWGQPFVVRLESPVETLGGGRVLFPNRLQTARPTDLDWEYLAQLSSNDERERVAAAIFLLGFSEWMPLDLVRLSGVGNATKILTQLLDEKTVVRVSLSKERQITVHKVRVSELSSLIVTALKRLHDKYPLRLGHPLLDLQSRFDYLPTLELFRSAVQTLVARKQVVVTGANVALEGHGPQLSKGERLLFEDIVQRIKNGGVTPPTPAQITATATKNKHSVQQLVKLAVDAGLLIQIDNEWVVHTETWRTMLEKIQTAFKATPKLTVSDIKAVFDLTRKHTVPLCEYLDRLQFTKRDGDIRIWNQTRE